MAEEKECPMCGGTMLPVLFNERIDKWACTKCSHKESPSVPLV